jgi:hypothetical protein
LLLVSPGDRWYETGHFNRRQCPVLGTVVNTGAIVAGSVIGVIVG